MSSSDSRHVTHTRIYTRIYIRCAVLSRQRMPKRRRPDVGAMSERRRPDVGATSERRRSDVGPMSERRRADVGPMSERRRPDVGATSERRRPDVGATSARSWADVGIALLGHHSLCTLAARPACAWYCTNYARIIAVLFVSRKAFSKYSGMLVNDS